MGYYKKKQKGEGGGGGGGGGGWRYGISKGINHPKKLAL